MIMVRLYLYVLLFNEFGSLKFTVQNELDTNTISTNWIDQLTGQGLSLCRKNQDVECMGVSNSPSNIYWSRTYNLPQTQKLDIYIEFQISGIWGATQLEIYTNGVLMYGSLYTLNDQNRACNTSFMFETYTYIMLNQYLDQLKLEIKASKPNLGFYIQKILINQLTQNGRNVLIPFNNILIPECRVGSGLTFQQYYCQCPKNQVYQINVCKTTCDQNYLYDSTTNECYLKQNCNDCLGKNTILQCKAGYYKFIGSDSSNSNCLSVCPNDYYQDSNTMTCIEMSNYLMTTQNKGCNIINILAPVDHFYFFKDIANFFALFPANQIKPLIVSQPQKLKERSFIYHNGKFVVGSMETFQSQSVLLQLNVQNSQHRLRFRAKAHFIDFLPSTLILYINGVLQPQSSLQQSLINEKKVDQDYYAVYDLIWVRTELYPVTYNRIQFQIEQPLQNGAYQGYFYLDEIHIYQHQCVTGCNSCYKIDYCTPCLNPGNKDPSNCQCISGYIMKNDICIACPTYCTTCSTDGACDSCSPSTFRINPPLCQTCQDQYFIFLDYDICYSCPQNCKKCSTSSICIQCMSGYFKTISAVCVASCGDGYFGDNSDINNSICSQCNINCNTCQTTSTTCLSCKGSATLINNICLLCADGYYIQGSSCQPCDSGCQICQGSICSRCLDQYYLQISTSTCTQICNQNQFQNPLSRTCDLCDATCQSCVASTNKDCLSCSSGRVLNIQAIITGFCQTTCFPGYYRAGDSCAKCWIGCSTCIDASQTCLICGPNYYRLKSSGQCYDTCPDGYYNNRVGFYCSICDATCSKCNGGSLICTTCTSPLSLYQNQCLQSCPQKYGSVNSICEPCTINCLECFGVNPDQCLICATGYYFLKNQCHNKCPTSFIGIRPQYVCKCQYDNCISCTEIQFFYENQCYDMCPQGTFGYNSLCVKCDVSCGLCFGEQSDQCINCDHPLILNQNTCVYECLDNTFHDLPSNSCQLCHESCLACNGPTDADCTACADVSVYLTASGTCSKTCPIDQYLVQSEKRCYNCDPSCLSCFGPSPKNCNTCKNLFYLHECVDVCPDGFTISINQVSCDPDFALVIDKCSYQCQSCELVPRFCTQCAANRMSNPPNCDCIPGYYDDGINSICGQCANKCLACKDTATNCISCKGNRQLPNCDCPKFYYDDGTSVNCIKCADNCATCTSDSCITCLNDRINAPDCACLDGYYEAYAPFCKQCAKKCTTCDETDLLCQTCSDIRINPPICSCPEGYFENSDMDCQQCIASCKDCNLSGCLSCSGNRVGPLDGQCQCSQHGLSRLSIGSVYCTDCQVGVPYIGLNDNFDGFSFDFGGTVVVTDSGDLCQIFFTEESLLKLGTDPQCDFNFNVWFGDNPKMKVGDLLELNPNFLLLGCSSPFKQIIKMPLQIPSVIDHQKHLPLIEFNSLENANICTPISIIFETQHFNGKQQLNIISWEMILPASDDTIIQILDANTLNNSDIITFPPLTLQPETLYRFNVKVESFAFLQNTLTIEFIPGAYATVDILTTSDVNQFHRFDNISIVFSLYYYNCIEKEPPTQNLFYQISLKNNHHKLMNNTISKGMVNGFEVDIPVNFEQFYFNFSSPYTLVLSSILSREDYDVQTTGTFDIYIIPSLPQLKILQGNRMVGYDVSLIINTTITDPDLNVLEASTINYTCYWKCSDIINETACADSNKIIIQFDNNCQQNFKAKTFSPYQVLIFEVEILKNAIPIITNVSIQIVELDLPSLIVTGVDPSMTYNYYDEFLFHIVYPGVNSDLIMYAGTIIYDQVIQATYQFYYLDVKFKLLNYFTDLRNDTSIKLRLALYDPRFIMPSLNTQVLKMNIPPQNCQIEYQKQESFVEFLDYMDITVKNCEDNDQPLLYSIYLYPNQSILQLDILEGNYNNRITIIPPQNLRKMRFTLPYFNKDSSVVVVQIIDSEGGFSNLTQLIKIKEYESLNRSTLQYYQSLQPKNLDLQLISFELITQRLSKLKDYRYREDLFKELIFLDTNQTLKSNQTQSLYRSISSLLGSNSSLLILNEFYLLGSINQRISEAHQKLTFYDNIQRNKVLSSGQTIQKTIYILQLFTFSNIFSSFINYRVGINASSLDIQQSLYGLITYLQDFSVANEPLCKFQTNSLGFSVGYLTSKITQQVIGTTLLNDNYENLLKGNSTAAYNSSTNFYKYSTVRYIDNPYYAINGFPKNSSGQQAIDPKLIMANQTNMTLKQAMSFSFPENNQNKVKNSTFKCIAQVNTSAWSAGICKTVIKNNEVICQCDTLNPTSVMESLDYILDKAQEIYSINTLLAFASFPFYKTVVFYFYSLITVSYLAIVYWGMKVDNIMFSKIQQQNLENKEIVSEAYRITSPQNTQTVFKRTIFRRLSTKVALVIFPQNTLLENQQQQTKNEINSPKQLTDENNSHRPMQLDSQRALDDHTSIHSGHNLKKEEKQQLETIFEKKPLSKFAAYIEYLKFFHQILSIIYKDDETKPRGLRATIVYTSTMGSLAILFVFNQPKNISFTITLALLTAPVNKIYQIILEKLLSNSELAVRTFGGIIMICACGLISYTMLAGLVLQGSIETANQWSYIFISSFSLDNILYTPIQLIFQYCINTGLIRFPILQKILNILLDEKGKEFLKTIIQKMQLM